jgi:hypothetical protein
MRATVRGVALAAMVVLGASRLASAAFHQTLIDEVMSGVGADASIQYVEIRMLSAGQVVVTNTRLTVFSCDGTTKTVLLLVPGPNLTNSGAGTRWIMATPSFAAAACIAPDFTFTPPEGHPGIFPTCGMVCWGAPFGITPPPPASWDLTDPDQYIDCLAYGAYTGPVPSTGFTSANSADPANGSMSLTRSGNTRFNSAQFGLAAPSPRNNAGQAGAFGSPCVTTTTTTTVSGAGGGPTTMLAPPFSGGPPKKTDCFSEWIVAGAAGGKPAFKCRDNDPACDTSPDRGCIVRAQVCFNDAANPTYKGKCAGGPVTKFLKTSSTDDQIDLNNWNAMGAAVAALGGGQISPPMVTFATPLTGLACTAPFNLTIPLGTRGPKTVKGTRKIVTATTAGKVDRDSVKITCTPP